jgi:hypothetical protein
MVDGCENCILAEQIDLKFYASLHISISVSVELCAHVLRISYVIGNWLILSINIVDCTGSRLNCELSSL